ncbi:MAG TPA: CBS domain-containing protein [Casimicrobiaceae bacterium]
MTKMRAGVACQPPGTYAPKSVRVDSPAIEAMTDLRQVATATISADATLAQANQAMIARGVRLLLVVGHNRIIEGLITARDTMGERPVKLLRERGGKHRELTVADLMVPRSAIDVLDIATVRRAEVGHIIATLKELGRQHALVVDKDPLTGQETVRGIFSATQIGRQLGVPVVTFEVARTFAEIEAELAK